MPDFDCHASTKIAADRLPAGCHGEKAWRDLVSALEQVAPESQWGHLDAFDAFQASLRGDLAENLARECRVFVSHRSTDVVLAKGIAKIVANTGFGYWIDAEDPVLQWATGHPIPSPAYEILVAAAIEIALLNSTHVIAAMTPNSAGSKWIPYEYGRARERLITSQNSAIWLQRGMRPAHCGEYVVLGVITGRKQEIVDWLTRTAACKPPANPGWPAPDRTEPDLPDLPDAPPRHWEGR